MDQLNSNTCMTTKKIKELFGEIPKGTEESEFKEYPEKLSMIYSICEKGI